MTITRHNKILYTWKKLKANKKWNEDKREQKKRKSSELENKSYGDLGKENRFKPFCG